MFGGFVQLILGPGLSALQKPKHCLTCFFLHPLVVRGGRLGHSGDGVAVFRVRRDAVEEVELLVVGCRPALLQLGELEVVQGTVVARHQHLKRNRDWELQGQASTYIVPF